LVEGAGELLQSVANEVVPGVVEALDVDEVVQRLDVQAIVDRIDLDTVLDRVDVDRLIKRVDLEAVLAGVDLNTALARVDFDAVLARTELSAVISRSGSALASRGLDLLRSQAVGMDAFIERWTDRLFRRQPRATRPKVPIGSAQATRP
jgi:hypothetical protein